MSGWVDTYQPAAFQPRIVETEGDYRLKIESVTTGTMDAKPDKNEGPKRYYKVECCINAKGYPHVSIFITEGKNFDATATAFFDTFGIQYGNWNIEQWRGHEGNMHISLFEKNGYKDQRATYILNSDGRVPIPPQSMQRPVQQTMGNGYQYGNFS